MLPGGLNAALAQPQRTQPIQEVKIAIQALHDAVAKEPEPEDKAVLATCLQNLLKLQAKNMAEAKGGGSGGAGGPSPPRGPTFPQSAGPGPGGPPGY